jgi:hypothetical protein
VQGFTADALHQPKAALRHAQATLGYADTLGISHDTLRWAWPLAARAAHDLRDTTTVGQLLTLLDSRQPGYLAPMLRAEHDLALARLTASESERVPAVTFTAALDRLREQSTPYHLAHGLLDYAADLIRLGDTQAAAVAIEEACDIARRLRCQPLLDRAADMTPADLRVMP